MAQNIDVKQEPGKLILTIHLTKPVGPTGSGSNIMLASTGKSLNLVTSEGTVTLALNVYREAKPNTGEIEACALRAAQHRADKAAKETREAAIQAAMGKVNATPAASK